ncbi:MAG: hypothetical protein JO254_00155 [Pseudolabrys sp.]|nr:hypothetical protein [Pseudolabrys sp.]
MAEPSTLDVTFRCAPELIGRVPPPLPAVEGIPGWFKQMPQKAFNAIAQCDTPTVKKCPPFVDAMTFGFLMPLPCDVTVRDGEFSWELDLPHDTTSDIVHSPISFHDESQVADTPFHKDDRFIIKFHNFWTIETPPGYSLLFTHPVNRPDLPFTTVTGLVDSDTYADNHVHFPAFWHDPDFNGVLPKGTPIAQCMPMKRTNWQPRVEGLSEDDAARMRRLSSDIKQEAGVYRRQFRARKR